MTLDLWSIERIIDKSLDGGTLEREEMETLFEVPPLSPQSGIIRAAARQKSERASGGFAEIHVQLGVNLAPCPGNCRFCSFAACNGVFDRRIELSIEEVVSRIRDLNEGGANAIYLMATAQLSFPRFLEMAQEVSRNLNSDIPLIANVGDMDLREARQLRDAGVRGIYHAVRMGEGVVTGLNPNVRIRTMRNAREAGLALGTCVEPVGPEHDVAELVEKTLITRDAGAVFSGSARRISIPGTEMERYGMISEMRMAHDVAVVRLAMPDDVPGNCTHEPCTLGAAAGANLLWAEAGPNPRDIVAATEDRRGMTVEECRRIFEESEWKVLEGPSRFFSGA